MGLEFFCILTGTDLLKISISSLTALLKLKQIICINVSNVLIQQLYNFRHLATGASFSSLGYSFRIGRSTISVIVKETVTALWEELQPIHMPQPTKNSTEQTAEQFWRLWNFPNCAGAIDGKHIRIRCPAHSGSMFYNYKKYFSLVLQGVADANCKFITIEVGGYGKQSDGGTFSSSQLYQQLKNRQFLPADTQLPDSDVLVPYVLVGDEAYPLLDTLLRPYARRDCTTENEYFNSRLSRARKCIECAFGIITAKWRLLWKPIETDPSFGDLLVKAICVLHNTIIDLEGNANAMQEANNLNNNRSTSEREGRFNAINMTRGRVVRDAFRDFVFTHKL